MCWRVRSTCTWLVRRPGSPPADWRFAPRGVPHAFLVVSDVARLLFLHTPGCCQDFYWDASEPLAAGAAASGPVDFSRVLASAQKNGGMTVVGPPPFAAGG